MSPEQEDAFEAFVAVQGDALLRTAFLLTGQRQEAEDLLANALERLARHWPRVLRHARPDLYARKILTNLATDRWRWLARHPSRPFTEFDEDTLAVGDHSLQTESRDLTARLLHQLPTKQRAVLVLRYFDDMSDNDIAETLGCTHGTVRSQASRGLARMRVLVADPAHEFQG